MPNFSVKCVDRKSAKNYDITVQADNAVEASRLASQQHILAANHPPTLMPSVAVESPTGKPIFDPSDKQLFRTIMHAVFWGVFGAQVVWLVLAAIVWVCFAIANAGERIPL